jgi:hypothetical protein
MSDLLRYQLREKMVTDALLALKEPVTSEQIHEWMLLQDHSLYPEWIEGTLQKFLRSGIVAMSLPQPGDLGIRWRLLQEEEDGLISLDREIVLNEVDPKDLTGYGDWPSGEEDPGWDPNVG